MLMWTIWFRRNQILVKNIYRLSHLTSYLECTTSIARIPTSKPCGFNISGDSFATTKQMVSTPPKKNSLKVNFDEAIFKDISKAGIGVVIQDNQGQAIASLLEQIPLPFSSDVVEAQAAARAIAFALEIGCRSFVLEGDSESVIKTLSSEDESLAPFGHILTSAKSKIDANCISFSYVRRLGNSVAHNLAKRVSGYSVWM